MSELSYEAFTDVAQGKITEDSLGRLRPFFREEPVLDEEKSREEGRPIFKMVEYVRIQSPGERDNINDRQVLEWDKRRFANFYEHWKKTKTNRSDGTPLETWAVMSAAQVEELKFFHIHTIEDLAALSDDKAMKFRGIMDWKQKAKDHIAQLSGERPLVKIREELSQKDVRLKQMADQMAEQKAMIEALQRKLENRK